MGCSINAPSGAGV